MAYLEWYIDLLSLDNFVTHLSFGAGVGGDVVMIDSSGRF